MPPRAQMNKGSCDRLDAVLAAVRQGALGLQQRLGPFKGLLGLEVRPLMGSRFD